MEKEHKSIIEEKHFEDIKEYWGELMKLVEDDDPSAVEHLFLNRGEFSKDKFANEDKIWAWLKGRAENKLGRKLLVELSEKGIIVTIGLEEDEK